MKILKTQSYVPISRKLTKSQMKLWKSLNNIPQYTDATYDGFTGVKYSRFPLSSQLKFSKYPDVTDELHDFESEVLQDLLLCRNKRFGYLKALWKMCRNLGTGEAWDSKFLPNFPGRNEKGKTQYAIYNGKIVSANDVSNILYGHICKFMGIPLELAKFIARLDATGVLEPFSKGKMPSLKLLKFRDTKSDQLAIEKGFNSFELSNYKLYCNA